MCCLLGEQYKHALGVIVEDLPSVAMVYNIHDVQRATQQWHYKLASHG
jgi:hypothetical protein